MEILKKKPISLIFSAQLAIDKEPSMPMALFSSEKRYVEAINQRQLLEL